jgi:hypothetical protein
MSFGEFLKQQAVNEADIESEIRDTSLTIIDGERPWSERKRALDQFYEDCLTMSATGQNLVAVAVSFEK